MRILKSHPLLKLANSYLIDSAQPSNISYLWNFGSLLAFCLVIQIITGVTLAMHYNPSVLEAFNSVEHIMRDVNNGWLIRYIHSNTASAFFFLVYLHIGRGLFYGSYKAPRTLVWTIGTFIFILMMATAFLGYVLPYGQMSLWGATVITNLMSAIPWVGQDIVEFIWGGFSVNNATLNRFFALHFVLPFVLAALALMHLIALHDTAGSSNPLGVSGNYDRLSFAPYFLFKDLITIFLFIFVLSLFVFFMPNVLGDSENYVMANPMQTPAAIVPEWYLLPFYAILRSIPNKLLGVIAMFSAILILLSLPIFDLSKLKGMEFKPLLKVIFFIFIANFIILMILGAKHVESPYIEIGQISAGIYFCFFVYLMPLLSILGNIFVFICNIYKSNRVLIGVTVYATHLLYKKVNNNFLLFILKIVLLSLLFNLSSTEVYAESPENSDNDPDENSDNDSDQPVSQGSQDGGYESVSEFNDERTPTPSTPRNQEDIDELDRYMGDRGSEIEGYNCDMTRVSNASKVLESKGGPENWNDSDKKKVFDHYDHDKSLDENKKDLEKEYLWRSRAYDNSVKEYNKSVAKAQQAGLDYPTDHNDLFSPMPSTPPTPPKASTPGDLDGEGDLISEESKHEDDLEGNSKRKREDSTDIDEEHSSKRKREDSPDVNEEPSSKRKREDSPHVNEEHSSKRKRED